METGTDNRRGNGRYRQSIHIDIDRYRQRRRYIQRVKDCRYRHRQRERQIQRQIQIIAEVMTDIDKAYI